MIGGAFGYINGTMTRIALLIGILTILLVLIWWVLLSLFRLLPMAFSLVKAVLLASADRPAVARWLAQHPKAAGWLSARFEKDTFAGLPLTCLSLVFGYFLIVWADVTLDFIFASPAFALDANVAQFVHLFWSPALLRTASYMTALGDSRVIAALLIAALILLAMERRWALMSGLVVAVLGKVLSVVLLKSIFERPRPDLAYFVETSGSFPSGHAAISVAFYGTLFYVMWRSGRLGHVAAVMVASLLAFVIGLSRVLLVEHYLTDVLNGWLVGSLWLLVGATIAEWRLHSRGDKPGLQRSTFAGVIGFTCVALLVGFGVWRVVTYDKALTVQSTLQSEKVVEDPRDVLSAAGHQTFTTTLAGTPSVPVNLILVARTKADLNQVMSQAGWSLASDPTPGRLIDLAFSVIRDQTDQSTMVFPLFWAGMPNAMAMQTDLTGKAPLVARFWPTSFVTRDGRRVFVAAVTPDDRTSETTPAQADIGQARDRLITTLRETQANLLTLDIPTGDAVPVIDIR